MDKNTCETCKHFTLDTAYEVLGNCDRMGDINNCGPDIPDDTAAYGWDYEGYMAGVSVGINFGCIYWAAKEDQING